MSRAQRIDCDSQKAQDLQPGHLRKQSTSSRNKRQMQAFQKSLHLCTVPAPSGIEFKRVEIANKVDFLYKNSLLYSCRLYLSFRMD
jgi:hypothetical protein